MTPFYFGTEQRRLFGIYEPALRTVGAERAVLLCYPLGNEQIFAYRTIRQLAARLAGAGFHVLRFDYFGTGDSYGDTGEGDITGWYKDIETAIDELREMTAVAQVSLVGGRLGANLAASAAASRPGDIRKLILWDPLNAGELANRFSRSEKASQDEEIALAGITRIAARLPRNTLLLLTTRSPDLKEAGSFDILHRAGASPWIEERVANGSIPADTLQLIVDCLK